MHEELFDKYLAGALTPDEAGLLARLLKNDPAVGKSLVAYIKETGLVIQVGTRLESLSGAVEETRILTGEAARKAREGQRKSTRSIPIVGLHLPPARRTWAGSIASIAAGVLAVAGLLLYLAKGPKPAETPEVAAGPSRASARTESAAPPLPSPALRADPGSPPSSAKENSRPIEPVPSGEKSDPGSREPLPSEPKKPEPQPLAPRKPALPIPPRPLPAPKSPLETGSLVAYVEKVEGEVQITGSSSSVAARYGQSFFLGQGMETRGPKSRASLRYPDGTQLTLEGETIVGELSENGRRIALMRGILTADVAKQPAGLPLVVRTPQGRVEVLGTRFTVLAGVLETRLYVEEGRVRLSRESDHASIEVKAGYYAVAAPGVILQALPQDRAVDQAKIDAAIRKGIEYLKRATSPIAWQAMGNSDELLLWTFIHAGVPASDPDFQRMLRGILESKLERTYKVALQAMILEELDRVRYQPKIAQCAQFLLDNQCKNGQWSYGEPSAFSESPPEIPRDVPTAERTGVRVFGEDTSERRVKPKVVRKFPVKKMRDGPAGGDNSNSQYAALGLRACFDAGIVLPRESIVLAKKWWMENQHPGSDKELKSVATGGVSGPARGWCYCADLTHKASGSMTAGAVGSLAIYDFILDVDWKRSSVVQSGMGWLANHFSVTENIGHGPPCREAGADEKSFYFYFMYGLERAGMLYGTEKIGASAWYPLGAKVLVEKQAASGAWEDAYGWNKSEWNTCFAILFLRRATRPLDVASEDRRPPKK